MATSTIKRGGARLSTATLDGYIGSVSSGNQYVTVVADNADLGRNSVMFSDDSILLYDITNQKTIKQIRWASALSPGSIQLPANSTVNINIPSNLRGILFIFRSSTNMALYMIMSNSSGTVYICDIKTVSNVILSSNTNNTITVDNGSTGNAYLYYIATAEITENT